MHIAKHILNRKHALKRTANKILGLLVFFKGIFFLFGFFFCVSVERQIIMYCFFCCIN